MGPVDGVTAHEVSGVCCLKIPSLKRLGKNRQLLLMVVAPTLLTLVYETGIASDIYVSESRFVIKAPSQKAAQISTLASLIQTTALSGGQEQSWEVIEYIRSRSALNDLQKQFSVERVFSREGSDVFSRYPGLFRFRSQERLFHYYQDMVSSTMDHETGVVVLKVKAFDAADAQQLNERLLGMSERLVNTLNNRAQGKQVAEAERRVAEAEARVARARTALGAFRNAQALLDPSKQATGVLEISNKLVAERASVKAQLDQMRIAAPRNPAIPALEARLDAMDHAIATQDGRAVGSAGAIASKLPSYEALMQEQEFAAANLNAANASLVQARADSVRQQYYLERIVQPSAQDEPALPHRWKTVLTVLAASLCLYVVAWMFLVGILEHAPED